MRRVAAVLAFALFAGASALAGDVRPIVVELYTSQGCSSCPPADALLAKLSQRQGVIAMSLPITYWDMLGWKDTLASEANTRRQKAYAATMRRGGVYTPQIVVDGTKDVVGSREDAVENAIEDAADARDEAVDDRNDLDDLPVGLTSVSTMSHHPLRGAWSVGTHIVGAPQRMRVAISAAPGTAGKGKLDATIWLFRLRTSAVVRIGAGENSGRTATYRNVVSEIRELGHWRGEAVALDLPRSDAKTPPHDSLAIVVQQGGYGRVIGAAYLRQALYYSQR